MIEINWGPQTRLQLLQHLIDTNGYKSYLEIGCDRNQVFDSIQVMRKEGVDPVRGGTVRMTSDEYFKKTCDCEKWDLIFIDGLHEYEQVKRDFWNAYAKMNPNSTIVIHDMLPTREGQAGSEPTEKYWLGDVWRLGFDLMGAHVDFKILTFDFGCGIVRPPKAEPFPITFEPGPRDWAFYERYHKQLPLTTWEEYFGA